MQHLSNFSGRAHLARTFLPLLVGALFLLMPTQAQAACSGPAAPAGALIYNGDNHVAQYCNNTGWVGIGPSSTASCGLCMCSNPTGPEGEIKYNGDWRVMQYCNGTTWMAMAPPAYIAWGQGLAGNTYLKRGANLTGGVDGTTFTISFWLRRTAGTGTLQRIYQAKDAATGHGRFDIHFDTANKIHIVGKGTGGGTVRLDVSSGTAITDANWHHVMFNIDMSGATFGAKSFMYIDGVQETVTVTTYTSAATINYARTEHTIASSAGTLGTEMYSGELADFYLSQVSLDLSNAATRAKFRNGDGTPVDLGSTCQNPTGTSALVCLTGKNPATWVINKGVGGGFTQAGQFSPLGEIIPSTANLPGLSCSHQPVFALKDDIATGAEGVWGDGTYIYVAAYTGGLKAYTFDGSTLTLVGSAASSQARQVWGDVTYIYLADGPGGLKAYTFTGSTFTLKGSVATWTGDVWGDGTYLYATQSTSGLKAYTFNGTTFTQAGSTTATDAASVWGDGIYVYMGEAQSAGFKAYTFNGTTFTLKDTQPADSPFGVWGDGTYIYVADVGVGISAYTFNGTSLTLKSTFGSGGARAVWGDGSYVYVAAQGTGVRVFTFDGSLFTYIGTITSGTNGANDVWGDGTYIYAAGYTNGLRAYAKTADQSANLCSCSSPAGIEGQIVYNNDYNKLQYCNGTGWRAFGEYPYP